MIVLALDVSSVSTGWACLTDLKSKKIKSPVVKIKDFGCISPKSSLATERLIMFESQLKNLIYESKPDLCVIEDLNYLRNMKVVKVLASFLGVAKKICYEYHKTEPFLIRRTHALKQTIGNGDASKADVVKYIEDLFGVTLPKEGTEDIADAILTGYCYILESKAGNTEGEDDGKK